MSDAAVAWAVRSEAVENVRPAAHAANAVELSDGSIFLNWYAGSFEGGEDQVIVGTYLAPGAGWATPRVLVGRFRHDGEEWLPEIGVPLVGEDELQLFFWAVPMSGFRMGVWRGEPAWRRQIDRVRLFGVRASGLEADDPRPMAPDENLVLHGSAMQLPSGRWLMPCHTEGEGLSRRGRMLASADGGGTWTATGDLFADPGCLEPAIALRPDGRVVCYMRTAGYPRRIWFADSTDGADTWSEVVATNLRNPGSGIDVASSSSGRLLLVWNDSEGLRTPLTVGLSEDEGRTWLSRDVESGRGEFSYPKLLQTSDGLWHLFYTHQRTHVQHVVFDEERLVGGRKVVGVQE